MSEDRSMKPMPPGKAKQSLRRMEGLLRLVIGVSLVRVQLLP